MKQETYRNRYGNIFKFTPDSEGNVLWEGDFEYARGGYPNDYTLAYKSYIDDGGTLSISEFTIEVHRSLYDESSNYLGPSDIAQAYGSLVKSNKDIICMVDPSGGPYLAEGMASTMAHSEITGKTISHFVPYNGGYKIVLK